MRKTGIVGFSALCVLTALGGGLDDDGDGVPNDVDCRPSDPTLWAPPAEPVDDLTLSYDGVVATLAWSPPANTGGVLGTERYDTFGTFDAEAFGHPTGYCVELNGVGLSTSDDRTLQPGQVTHFLVRVENDCGAGPIDTVPAPVQTRSLHYLVATNTNDSGPGSLREAIGLAAEGNTICIDASGTILLASDLEVETSISVVGPGPGLLTLDHDSTTALRLSGDSRLSTVSVTGGAGGVGVVCTADSGVITLDSVSVSGLHTGISIFAGIAPVPVIVADSLISGNGTGIQGWGDIYGEIAITRTTIAGNDRGYAGDYYWDLTVTDSTISDNGIGLDLNTYAYGKIRSSTISGNDTGIRSLANYPDTVVITSSTISGNQIGVSSDYSYLTFRNTILSNVANCAIYDYGPNLDATSEGHNMISDSTCNGFTDLTDQLNASPQLAPLADNGGPTETQMPLPGSPVIDTGSCPGETRDQRGAPRPVDAPGTPNVDDACDIGAVERRP